ncbi:MAG: flagellar export protein FliJ [Deltaproteobacteria bacterium]|jgi:flagellar protein FliJ|nr:flagellar export protein FliJ [Deltaproteobacteria bacterium]MBT4525397.1 flagellar export protein FliJ [Deltaproteobacteria bacterium]
MFQFSLQTALDVRLRQEKIKMKDLAEKVAIEQSIKNQIDGTKNRAFQADISLNQKKQAGSFTIQELKMQSSFKARTKLELADYYQKLELAHQAVEEKQNILIQASRARKTLEILKEKELKRFMEKIAQLERKHMDEIAGNQFQRNRIKNH